MPRTTSERGSLHTNPRRLGTIGTLIAVITLTILGGNALSPAHADDKTQSGTAGACCMPDGCIDVANESECGAMGGIFLEGESCADDACGIGACCQGVNCGETDAYTCIAAGREFAGVGTTCFDDPCEANIGACCFGSSCEDLSPAECADQGGTWLGAGTFCDFGPCDDGACCIDEDTCIDLRRFECDDLEAEDFIAGADCEESPCGPPSDCPPDTLYGQSRDQPDDFLAGTSEANSPFRRYDDFDGVAGTITDLTFWGVDLDFVGGQWVECVEDDPTFEIAFYTDAGGQPGELVSTQTVLTTRTPTGIFYLGTELNEYTVTLDTPVVMVRGWISIVGMGDPECWFIWMSADLFGSSWCDGCVPNEQDFDLSFCLRGESGGVFGACCDDSSGQCAEGIEITECLGESQRFLPDGTCDDFDPPCGTILGACCFPDNTCEILTEEDCADADEGAWLGANTTCAQCPCITPCPKDGIDEGEEDCFDGYDDIYNGGCFADTNHFTAIEPGQTVCGTAGVYMFNGENIPDTDWYLWEATETIQLTWTVDAEFPARALILDGSGGCPGTIVIADQKLECERVRVQALVDPGIYWMVTLPYAFTDTSACGSRYTATFNATFICDGDINLDNAVDVADVLLLLAAWGTDGDGADLAEPIDVVDVSDLLVVLANWGSCGE